jgi:flavin reductase (DIM6/NTAB) family NADH-FMN oxidoreductase RutF
LLEGWEFEAIRSAGARMSGERTPALGADAVGRHEFVASMAAFPTGVTVVTTLAEDGEPRGLTCNAFMSVSVEPPLVLVSLDATSNTLPALRSTRHFVVNFLTAGREALALLFATKHPEKFASVSVEPTAHGLPVLHEDSIAYVVCEVVDDIEAGDHVLFLGRVYEARPPDDDAVPLLYYRRSYDRWPGAG